MTEWPSSPCRDTKRPNLKLGACVGVFSQLFHWNRVVGGQKYLSNRFHHSDGDASADFASSQGQSEALSLGSDERDVAASPRSVRSQESSPRARSRSSEAGFSSSDCSSSELIVELRHLLDAKQEPFILQEVIREKRQPVRIKSSRGLKPEISVPYYESKKSHRSRRSKSASQSTASELQSDNVSVGSIVPSTHDSTHRRNRAPPESIVSLPSAHQSPVHASRKSNSSSKTAAPGVSTVKSPNNKRALLMEAAAKILEGSNRSRKPLSSVRCLLAELDGKQSHEKPKEKLLRAIASRKEMAQDLNQSVNLDRIAEGKKQLTKLKTKHMHGAARHSESQPGTPSQSPTLSFQSRLVESAEFATLASASPDAEVDFKAKQRVMKGDGKESKMRGDNKENKPLDNSESSVVKYPMVQRQPFKPVSEVLTIEDNVVAASSFPMEDLSFFSLPSSPERQNDKWSSDISSECSSETLFSEHESSSSCSSSLSTENMKDSGSLTMRHTQETYSKESAFPVNSNANILRLCNYSWWEKDDALSSEVTLATDVSLLPQQDVSKIEQSLESSSVDDLDYPSPPPSKNHFSVKVFEDGRTTDGDQSVPHGYACMDECQQSSPVSILDVIFEEDSSVESDPLEYFEEARQQMLEKVRRFEMLAKMDLDSLMKLAEEECAAGLESYDQQLDESMTSHNESAKSHEDFHHLEFGSPVRTPDHANGCRSVLQADSILHLIERCKEGDRLQTNFFLECLDEGALDVAYLEMHPWINPPRDAVQELGPFSYFALMGMIDEMVHPEIGCSKYNEFSREVEEISEEIEGNLFAMLMQELLTELVH